MEIKYRPLKTYFGTVLDVISGLLEIKSWINVFIIFYV